MAALWIPMKGTEAATVVAGCSRDAVLLPVLISVRVSV